MDTNPHTLNTLFEQLGLASDDADIERFVATHGALRSELSLEEAPFWSEGQAAFIREALQEDSDWAEAVDELSALLR